MQMVISPPSLHSPTDLTMPGATVVLEVIELGRLFEILAKEQKTESETVKYFVLPGLNLYL